MKTILYLILCLIVSLATCSKHDTIQGHLLADAISKTAVASRNKNTIHNMHNQKLLEMLLVDENKTELPAVRSLENILFDKTESSSALPTEDGKPDLEFNTSDISEDTQVSETEIYHAKDMVCDYHHTENVGSRLLCYKLDLNDIHFSAKDCTPDVNGNIVCEKKLFTTVNE
jgi:hypothetical protein